MAMEGRSLGRRSQEEGRGSTVREKLGGLLQVPVIAAAATVPRKAFEEPREAHLALNDADSGRA
jgi:hypothetical protein